MQATRPAPAKTNPDCPSDRRHGTGVAYRTDGCRCDEGRAANARTWNAWRLNDMRGIRQKTPAVGTRRRIQALMAIGWPKTVIARHLGITSPRLDVILRQDNVHRATADRVRAVYAKLAEGPGPSPEAAGQAKRLGYVPPIGWDDDQIDDPDGRPWAVIDDHGQRRYGESFSRPSARGDAERARALERQRVRRAVARRSAAEEQLRQVTELIAASDAAEVAS